MSLSRVLHAGAAPTKEPEAPDVEPTAAAGQGAAAAAQEATADAQVEEEEEGTERLPAAAKRKRSQRIKTPSRKLARMGAPASITSAPIVTCSELCARSAHIAPA